VGESPGPTRIAGTRIHWAIRTIGLKDAALAPDVSPVPDHVAAATSEGLPLAQVIRLSRTERPAASSDPLGEGAGGQAREFLERHYGARWVDIPAGLGRAGLLVEKLLTEGPTRLDADTVAPAEAITRGRAAIRAAATVADIVAEESEVLGEALFAKLHDLPLHTLDAIAKAVVELSTSPRPDQRWATPAAAEAADVVIRAHGEKLLASRELHEQVYRRFTAQVWDVPERQLRHGMRPWRILMRARGHRALRAASRDRRIQPFRQSAELILRARDLRAELAAAAPLLSSHLGTYDAGPLTDVSRAATALGGLRNLQDSLGQRLAPSRMAALLAADAFSARDVSSPAVTLVAAIAAWRADIGRLTSRNPVSSTAPELAEWARATDGALEQVAAGAVALEALGVRPVSLSELVNHLLARESIQEIDGATSARPAATLAEALGRTGTTSTRDGGSIADHLSRSNPGAHT
jgi:hypothetical protein